MDQQHIPNEARELLRDGQYAIVNDEILIGSYQFPFDPPHIFAIAEVMEEEEAGLLIAIDFVRHGIKRLVKCLKEMPEADREQYRTPVLNILKEFESMKAQMIEE